GQLFDRCGALIDRAAQLADVRRLVVDAVGGHDDSGQQHDDRQHGDDDADQTEEPQRVNTRAQRVRTVHHGHLVVFSFLLLSGASLISYLPLAMLSNRLRAFARCPSMACRVPARVVSSLLIAGSVLGTGAVLWLTASRLLAIDATWLVLLPPTWIRIISTM